MRFHKWLVLAVALMLLVTLFAGCAETEQEPAGDPDLGEETTEPTGDSDAEELPTAALEQKLQGEGEGKGGSIRVEVTMVGDEITAIDVLEHEEDEDVGGPALEQIPKDIIAAQSTEVDVVTGATLTSNGIMEAVADAIGQ
ncbi:MAG: FMN-binding protein [Firmicutes bacterium]|nr:FMN-binding protein [Bacillota bacterium]